MLWRRRGWDFLFGHILFSSLINGDVETFGFFAKRETK
jgi:hypothetical protein